MVHSDYRPDPRISSFVKFRKSDIKSYNRIYDVYFRDSFIGHCLCSRGLWMLFIPGFPYPIKAFSKKDSRIDCVEQYLVLFA